LLGVLMVFRDTYTYTCTHVYTHTHTHVNTHIYIHTRIHTQLHVRALGKDLLVICQIGVGVVAVLGCRA